MGPPWNLAVTWTWIFFACAHAQYFDSFDAFDSLTFQPACGLANLEGNWTVTGRLILPPEYSSFFKHQVVFRNGEFTNEVMCTVDIDSCGDDPNPAAVDSCWCIKASGNTKFNIAMRRLARVEESSKPLTVALPLESGCEPTELTKAVGIMPPVYNPGQMVHGTFQVEKSPEETLLKVQNVSVCPNHYIDLRFCVYNLIPDYHITMKIDEADRETTVTSSCLDMTHKFDFLNHSMYTAHVCYDENAWCPRTGEYVLNFIERTEGCSDDGCIDEEKTTCEAGNGALARQIANIHHEGNLYHVLCDTETDGGDWIIIQRRIYGNKDFYQPWSKYKDGFGELTTDFWMGLQKIHELCFTSPCELRVDLRFNGHDRYAQYSTFTVAGSSDHFRLTVNGYSGDAGDSLTHHSGSYFTTYDKDYDTNSGNCAEISKGGWWYKNCHMSNLNGWWMKHDNGKGINWVTLTGMTNSVTLSEMKVRVATGASGNGGNTAEGGYGYHG